MKWVNLMGVNASLHYVVM